MGSVARHTQQVVDAKLTEIFIGFLVVAKNFKFAVWEKVHLYS